MSDENVVQPENKDVKTPKERRSYMAFFNKVAKALPSMAIGAATVIAVKAGTVAAISTAPIWLTLMASAAAVAAATIPLEHVRLVNAERKANKESGVENTGLWKDYFNTTKLKNNVCRKKTAYKAIFNASATIVGGVAVMAFDGLDLGDKISDLFGVGESQAAAPTLEPVIEETTFTIDEPIAEPAPTIAEVVPEPTALERLSEILNGIETDSELANETLLAAISSGDMQAVKDMAYFMFNGLEGLPMDKDLAAELFTLASESGNVQATTDVAYIQYHGLAESIIPQDQAAAVETINELGRSWVGGESLLNSTNQAANAAAVSYIKP